MSRTIGISITLDNRVVKKSGKYALKLDVYHKRKRLGVGIDLTEEEFRNLYTDRKLKNEKEAVLFFQQKAEKIANELRFEFTFEKFKMLFYNVEQKPKNVKDVYTGFENYIDKLFSNGQYKTYLSYLSSLNSFRNFHQKKSLDFGEITVSFLNKYEKYLLDEGLSFSTIGIYTRCLRRIFNAEKISGESYPFGSGKYQPPAASNIKKALTSTDIKKIYNYVSDNLRECEARDMWLFSYFCNGINFKDISLLRKTDVDLEKSEITFFRAKTLGKNKNKTKIQIILNDDVKRIIDRWGNKNQKDIYLFPILKNSDNTAELISKRVGQYIKTTNKYLRRISTNLELSRHITTNFARHSFSTVLKRTGVPIEMISEQLGHSNIRTTEIYLDSFESEQKKEAMKNLLSFKNQED